MKTTAEMKIEISNARISNATIMPDGTCKLELEVEMATQEQNDNENTNDDCILVEASKEQNDNENANDDYILVEASKLSLKDVFMSHKPKTEAEKRFKATLTKVIRNGIEDFYRPVMDPSFSDKEEEKFHYMAGEIPAVGRHYNWWEETVKDSKLCFGTKAQYVAFLGVLIKMLVTKGWTVGEAWDAVCNDSEKLGHYYSKYYFENTGSSEICGFFDLANTSKILAKDEAAGGFWMAGGYCQGDNRVKPLADLALYDAYYYYWDFAVAWLVLKK